MKPTSHRDRKIASPPHGLEVTVKAAALEATLLTNEHEAAPSQGRPTGKGKAGAGRRDHRHAYSTLSQSRKSRRAAEKHPTE